MVSIIKSKVFHAKNACYVSVGELYPLPNTNRNTIAIVISTYVLKKYILLTGFANLSLISQ